MRCVGVLIAGVVLFGGTLNPLQAQTLQEGTWEGTTILPDGSSNRTDFDVAIENGELAITYHYMTGVVALTEISFEDDTLSYVFSADGALIRCSLQRQDDGSYTGECRSGSETGRHTMRPPG